VVSFAWGIGAKKARLGRNQENGLDNKKIGEQHKNQMLQRYLDITRFGERRQILQDGAAIIRALGAIVML
jgi:hypothetical protein